MYVCLSVRFQLATGSRCSNIVAGCGILSGLLYRANFLYIQSWLRIPSFISRFCSNYLLLLVQSRPPDEGAVPMGATLEIQQQQRMEILEQQMLLSQARQFSRQRNRAVRFARPVSMSLECRIILKSVLLFAGSIIIVFIFNLSFHFFNSDSYVT